MNKQILILNAGSSSIKYRIYNVENNNITAEGLCERIMVDGNFIIKFNDQKIEQNVDFPNHKAALSYLFDFLKSKNLIKNYNDIIGVGHRVVMGSKYFKKSTIVTKKELDVIKELIPLAPLHNDPEAKIIEEIQTLLPHATNVAVFDTSFHQTLADANKYYAIDPKIAEELKIQRYGFHGTSHDYITKKMSSILNKDKVNVIVCHLGNGSSICAVKNSLSVNTSMGLTPVAGLVMGTRSGDVDPGLIPYLCKQKNWTVAQADSFLNKSSGLLGLCGSSDMRDLIAKCEKQDSAALLTMKIFAKRVADYLAIYANDLEGNVDAIVFTAGIGENSAVARENIINACPLLKLEIEKELNFGKIGDYQLISSPKSNIPVYVVRTNEELMIYNDVKSLMNLK